MVKVAIITRTKNRPLLLERAIKSVMAQSFTDFQMVIVNDGGDEKPIYALLKKHTKADNNRIKVVTNKTSLGMEGASNIGIKSSSSKYIALLDDDDTWQPDFLKETIGLLETTDFKGVVTASEIVEEVIEGKTVKTTGCKRFAPEITQIRLFDLSGVNQFPNNSFVYSREVFEKVGYYDPKAPILGDWEFNVRFMRYFDIAFINKPLSCYHHRLKSTGSMANSLSVHAEIATRLLNQSLRKDLDNEKFGLGIVSNISESHRKLMVELQAQKAANADLARINNETIEQLSALKVNLNEVNQKLTDIQNGLMHKIKRKIRRTIG